MDIKISFLGAAQNVTGSRYLIEANERRVLVDCGLYQEREYKSRNWDPFPVPPKSINAILLTHAHLDHSGFLPRLVREGFEGKIYCTEATAEIARILLLDAAHLLEEDARFKRKRHEREGRKGPFPEVPLYTTDDAKASFPLFSPVKYGNTIDLGKGIEATFYDAGHTLGSAMIRLKVDQFGEERIILFSGDVGRWDKPLLHDPTVFQKADYVLVESTYGDRLHEPPEDMVGQVADVINSTVKAGGNIVIPAFALERAQELLYLLDELLLADRIPHLMVFLDSPMAVSITEVFRQHPELLDSEAREFFSKHTSAFDFSGLHLTRTNEESKAINHIKGTVIIIAGAGMCNGGRIKHHLVTNISRPDSTILFVGFQAQGTLGRQIVDGSKEVRILGQMYPVRARVVYLNGFSAHADRDQLLKWLSGLQKPPRCIFVTHGEAEAAEHFADYIKEQKHWTVMVPKYQEQVLLK